MTHPTLKTAITKSRERLSRLDELRAEADRLDDEADAFERASERLAERARTARQQAQAKSDEILRLIMAGHTGRHLQ